MPFTPIHMGPGILLKSLLQGRFSLIVFGWTQVVMDLQPLIVLMTSAGHLHGFSHTFMGATLIALFSAITGKYIADVILKFLKMDNHPSIKLKISIFSAFVGSFSHVILDAIMHTDVEPFFPMNTNNPFLGYLSISDLLELPRPEGRGFLLQ